MQIDIIKLEKMFSKKWVKPIKGSGDLFKVLIRQLRRSMNEKFSHKVGFRKLHAQKSKKYVDTVNRFSDKILNKITINYERLTMVVKKTKFQKPKDVAGKRKRCKKDLQEDDDEEPVNKELDNKKHIPIRISDLEENLQHLFAYYLGFESVDELYQNQPNIFFKKIGIVNLPV